MVNRKELAETVTYADEIITYYYEYRVAKCIMTGRGRTGWVVSGWDELRCDDLEVLVITTSDISQRPISTVTIMTM